MGRPTRFRPQFVPKIQQLLLLGLTNQRIAETLGVTDRTLENWAKKIPAVVSVFSSSRELGLAGVAKSMFQRANGYNVRKRRIEKDGTGNTVKVITERQHVPADVEAAKFILSRRLPELWPADRGVQVGVQVVSGLPDSTLQGLQELARRASGLAPMSGQRTISENAATVTQDANSPTGNGS